MKAIPGEYQLMVLLAAWCALRFGELTELRREDIDLNRGYPRSSWRGLGQRGPWSAPKSDAGVRDVAIPPHLIPLIKAHMPITPRGRDGLLFPSPQGITDPGALYARGRPARESRTARSPIPRPGHTGAVLAAGTGATLAELMGRLGHSTPGAAMRYQHAREDATS